jgi:hypothetical protein
MKARQWFLDVTYSPPIARQDAPHEYCVKVIDFEAYENQLQENEDLKHKLLELKADRDKFFYLYNTSCSIVSAFMDQNET